MEERLFGLHCKALSQTLNCYQYLINLRTAEQIDAQGVDLADLLKIDSSELQNFMELLLGLLDTLFKKFFD